MSFRLLGDVQVWRDGCLVEAGSARQLCVLAVLVTEANRPVAADELLDAVWGEHLPANPRRTMHGYLSRLRKLLAPEVAITRSTGGYALRTRPESVDVSRFRVLAVTARAQADDAGALTLLDRALALWRDEPFANLDAPRLNDLRVTLEEEHRGALLDRDDIRLRLGRHRELLTELPARVAAHPHDERLAGQLMLALYRAGGQAAALDHYHRFRLRLKEVSAKPGRTLRELHQRMLRGDPDLDVPEANHHAPRQLLPPPSGFVGRVGELRALTRMFRSQGQHTGTVVISAIGGVGGIGKTTLALRWAHEHADMFPDGQLYLDLQGFGPSGAPLTTTAACRELLSALGVPPAAVPAALDAQTALYRSVLKDKRILVVLDNAVDAAQVLPLLPGDPAPTVLVTSRRQLTGLVVAHGARSLSLDMLDEQAARELLTEQVGPARCSAEPDAVEALLRRCGGLPLALRIVAARAARSGVPLTELAAELGADDTAENATAVFSWTYRGLAGDTAWMFRMLGLAVGIGITVHAAASVAGVSVARTRRLLRELSAAHLAQEGPAGRYHMHDLVRQYAANLALKEESPPERSAAERRLVAHYLHTAHAADRQLYVHRPPIVLDPPEIGAVVQRLKDRAAALTWFDDNHGCLLAAQRLAEERGWDDSVWRLAWATTVFHWRRGQIHDHMTMWQAGLAAAQRLRDPVALGHGYRLVGHALGQAGRRAEADTHLRRALTLGEQTSDDFGQAHTEQLLAWLCDKSERHEEALRHAIRALRLAERLGNPVWTAIALDAVGWQNAQLGRHHVARVYSRHALVAHRAHRHVEGEADALTSLAHIAHRTGKLTSALRQYHQALGLRRRLGDAYAEADTLEQLGRVRLDLGQRADACRLWRRAVELYEVQRRTAEAERVRRLGADAGGSW